MLAVVDSVGREVLHYAGLAAVDARGRSLLAHYEIAGDALRVVVDDAQAVYPVRIDPYVQAAVLVAADGAASDNLGKSVAISADGSTVVAGEPYKQVNSNAYQGAVYVFVKPAGGWADGASTARLTALDGAAADYLGSTVAISADGTTIVAGASSKTIGANSSQGAAYVFVKPSSGGWVNASQNARLTASTGATNDRLGTSVSVNADGTTIAAGAPGRSGSMGAVYIFVKPAGAWAAGTENAILTASTGVAGDGLGHSVAVSGNGATIAAGSWWQTVPRARCMYL